MPNMGRASRVTPPTSRTWQDTRHHNTGVLTVRATPASYTPGDPRAPTAQDRPQRAPRMVKVRDEGRRPPLTTKKELRKVER